MPSDLVEYDDARNPTSCITKVGISLGTSDLLAPATLVLVSGFAGSSRDTPYSRATARFYRFARSRHVSLAESGPQPFFGHLRSPRGSLRPLCALKAPLSFSLSLFQSCPDLLHPVVSDPFSSSSPFRWPLVIRRCLGTPSLFANVSGVLLNQTVPTFAACAPVPRRDRSPILETLELYPRRRRDRAQFGISPFSRRVVSAARPSTDISNHRSTLSLSLSLLNCSRSV